jgi:hypothetical protein
MPCMWGNSLRWLAVTVAALPLAGCFDDQKQAVAKCELETYRTYPNQRTKDTIDAERYLELCMRAAGYNLELAFNKKCQPRLTELGRAFVSADQPYCYVPSSSIGRLIYKIEMSLG